MIEHLIGRLLAKRQTEPDKWVDTTVTSTDAATAYVRGSVEAEALVRRCQQWVNVCATRNTTECSGKCIRLYVAKGSRSRKWTRPVKSRQRSGYLRDTMAGPGHKAAFYAEQAGDIEEVTDHPILDALRKPNPWMFGQDLIRKFYLFGELTGNRYIHIVETDGTIELYPMSSQDTRPLPDRDNFLRGYAYGRDSTIEEFFMPDEVYHSQFMPSPVSPYMGIGPLHAVFNEADIDSAATQNELATWNNGARPDFVLGIDPQLAANTEYVKQLRAQVNKDHRGVKNRGKFLIAGATEVKPLQFTPREMEYILGKENVEQRIWAAFGVPESEVKLNDSNLASSRSGSSQYLRQTIKPRINQVAEEWTERLLPLYGIVPGEMWFAYDDPVPEDVQARADIGTKYTNAGILSINEQRAGIGYDPIEGADDLRFNGVPLNVLANPQPAGVVGELADAEDGEDDVAQATTGEDQADAAAAGDVQATALNGAQVTSLRDLAVDVATGQLPVGSATALAAAAFPLIAPATLTAIFAPLDKFTPEITPEQQAKIEAAKNPKPMPLAPAGGADAVLASAPPSAVGEVCIKITADTSDIDRKLKDLSVSASGTYSGTIKPLAKSPSCRCGACDSQIKSILSKEKTEEPGPPDPMVDRLTVLIAAAYRNAAPSITSDVMASVGHLAGATAAEVPASMVMQAVVQSGLPTMIVSDLGPEAASIFGSGWDKALQDIVLPQGTVAGSFDITNEFARAALDKYKVRLSQSITDTTAEALRSTLQNGVTTGRSIPELTSDVQGVMTDLADYAAERIARTESSRAYVAGRIESWKQVGTVKGRKWVLSGDPCPMCRAAAAAFNNVPLDMPMIPLGGSFTWMDNGKQRSMIANYAQIDGGDIHPNCSCDIQAVYA